jgi:hypothetical protein
MEEITTPLLNKYLQTVKNLQPTKTDDFFYTRLKAKMERKLLQQSNHLPIKTVWIVSVLCVLLIANSIILFQQKKEINTTIAPVNTVQSFANYYNQNITSY